MSIVYAGEQPRSALLESSVSDDEGDGSDDELGGDDDDVEALMAPLPTSNVVPTLRPGIVHRIDKGTTGLMVVAKDEKSHRHLCDQFKARTVSRSYWSLTLGQPSTSSGRVETNIDRDVGDRKRMAAYAYGSHRGRTAASKYRQLESLANGRAALVEWRLETGRTHQIRVHAKHLGIPLFGDDTYGGGSSRAVNAIAHNKPSQQAAARQMLGRLNRPALHALTIAFEHPVTGKRLTFDSALPEDFAAVLNDLRQLGSPDDAVES